MGKIAFVFSGQGAQYVGMGKSLYDYSPKVKELYEYADSVREKTTEQSFNGSEEELKITSNTQPCMYLVEIGACMALNENGIYADGVAGFSLGEIAALAYANAYSYKDGFKIVAKRGELMANSSTDEEMSMVAVLKLDEKTVCDTVLEFRGLYAVNFNSPGQIVVSGLKSSMGDFCDKIKGLGGRCVPLMVSSAFHSPFMNEASEKFVECLGEFDIKMPEISVYANLTAKPYDNDVINTLGMQMKSPVKWHETIENMIKDGYTDFIEVGAGKTLCGLIKKINKEVNVYSVEDKDSLLETIDSLKGRVLS